jgi:hypothetical protein
MKKTENKRFYSLFFSEKNKEKEYLKTKDNTRMFPQSNLFIFSHYNCKRNKTNLERKEKKNR